MTGPAAGRLPNVAVLGCGRSGTSIFCELFDALPGTTGWSEPLLAEVTGAERGGVAVKVPRTPDGVAPPPGCSVSLDDLTAHLGDDLVVFWIVRHPLDAVCSLRPGIAAGWSHHPRPPDWAGWLDRPLLERCAHHWATINGAGFDHVAHVATVVRFEDLIADPAAFARSVAGRLGLVVDGDDPGLATWTGRVRDRNDEHFVEAVTSRRHSRPDHVRRVGRWRDDLSVEEVAAVSAIVADGAARFGYELAAPEAGSGA